MQYPIIDLITSAYINNGWTGLDISIGKNLLQFPFVSPNYRVTNGITFSVNNDNTINVTGTSTDTAYYILTDSNNFILPAGTYTKLNPTNQNILLILYDSNNVPIALGSVETFTLENDTEIRSYYRVASGYEFDDILYPQIETGTQATSYEPYKQPTTDIFSRLKLPLPHYFPNPVIDSLKRASEGTMTNKDKEILTHYLTPLGIGGI